MNVWNIEQPDEKRYQELFSKNASNGKISGEVMRSQLQQKGLSPQDLSEVIRLSDLDRDGNFVLEEFVILMHLLKLGGMGYSLPNSLPPQFVKMVHEKYSSKAWWPKLELPETLRLNFGLSKWIGPFHIGSNLGSVAIPTSDPAEKQQTQQQQRIQPQQQLQQQQLHQQPLQQQQGANGGPRLEVPDVVKLNFGVSQWFGPIHTSSTLGSVAIPTSNPMNQQQQQQKIRPQQQQQQQPQQQLSDPSNQRHQQQMQQHQRQQQQEQQSSSSRVIILPPPPRKNIPSCATETGAGGFSLCSANDMNPSQFPWN